VNGGSAEVAENGVWHRHAAFCQAHTRFPATGESLLVLGSLSNPAGGMNDTRPLRALIAHSPPVTLVDDKGDNILYSGFLVDLLPQLLETAGITQPVEYVFMRTVCEQRRMREAVPTYNQ
jgi:hypothetical protein